MALLFQLICKDTTIVRAGHGIIMIFALLRTVFFHSLLDQADGPLVGQMPIDILLKGSKTSLPGEIARLEVHFEDELSTNSEFSMALWTAESHRGNMCSTELSAAHLLGSERYSGNQ